MSSLNGISLKFEDALNNGLFFLPRAAFKSQSLQLNLREEEFIFQENSFPSARDVSLSSFYGNCIAFSINNNKTVTYKYQLFYEDLVELPNTTDDSVGVYIRNLDDFHKLKPFTSPLSVENYGALNGIGGRNYSSFLKTMSADQYRKVMDGAWFIMSWRVSGGSNAIRVSNDRICGTNSFNTFQLNQDYLNSRAIFKSRRVNNTDYEVFVTNNSNLIAEWYMLIRSEGFFNRYWDVNPNISQISIKTLSSTNVVKYLYSPTNTLPITTLPGNQYTNRFGPLTKNPFNLSIINTLGSISFPGAFIGWDCNFCLIGTDNRGDWCDPNNNGDGWVIQPSLSSILENIINDNKFSLGLNLCINSNQNRYFLENTLYPLTNSFLSNVFNPKITTCNNIRIAYCSDIDPTTNKSNLFKSSCKDFCAKDYDCTDIVTEYCNIQGAEALSQTNREICGCNVKSPRVKEAYDKFVADYNARSLTFPNCDELKYTFSPCRVSSYGNSQGQTNIPPENCGSGENCVSYIEITNNGNITGDISADHPITGCESIFNQITSGTQSCTVSSDCKDSTNLCVDSKCVQCADNSNCSGTTPFCKNNSCVSCLDNTNCSGLNDTCVDGNCVECKFNTDCPTGKKCSSGTCINECSADKDCSTGKKCESGSCVNISSSTNYIVYGGVAIGFISILLLIYMFIRKNRR